MRIIIATIIKRPCKIFSLTNIKIRKSQHIIVIVKPKSKASLRYATHFSLLHPSIQAVKYLCATLLKLYFPLVELVSEDIKSSLKQSTFQTTIFDRAVLERYGVKNVIKIIISSIILIQDYSIVEVSHQRQNYLPFSINYSNIYKVKSACVYVNNIKFFCNFLSILSQSYSTLSFYNYKPLKYFVVAVIFFDLFFLLILLVMAKILAIFVLAICFCCTYQQCSTLRVSALNSCSFYFKASDESCIFSYCAIPSTQQLNVTELQTCLRSCCSQEYPQLNDCLSSPSSDQQSSDIILRKALSITIGIISFPIVVYLLYKLFYHCFCKYEVVQCNLAYCCSCCFHQEEQVPKSIIESANQLKRGSIDMVDMDYQLGGQNLPSQDCTICLQSNAEVVTGCGHSFHQECIVAWLRIKRECPNCKNDNFCSFKIYCSICRKNWIRKINVSASKYRFRCCNSDL